LPHFFNFLRSFIRVRGFLFSRPQGFSQALDFPWGSSVHFPRVAGPFLFLCRSGRPLLFLPSERGFPEGQFPSPSAFFFFVLLPSRLFFLFSFAFCFRPPGDFFFSPLHPFLQRRSFSRASFYQFCIDRFESLFFSWHRSSSPGVCPMLPSGGQSLQLVRVFFLVFTQAAWDPAFPFFLDYAAET